MLWSCLLEEEIELVDVVIDCVDLAVELFFDDVLVLLRAGGNLRVGVFDPGELASEQDLMLGQLCTTGFGRSQP